MSSFTGKRSPHKPRRTREKFVEDYAKLIEFMTAADLHEDTRREILYQAIQMYSGKNGYFDHFDSTWISEKAISLCGPTGRPNEPRTTVKEHVVPISVSIEPLWNAKEMKPSTLKSHLDSASIICVISNDEDACLRRTKLKSAMPPEASHTETPWARYDHPETKIPRKKKRVVYKR